MAVGEVSEREGRLALATVIEPGSGQLAAQIAEYGVVEVWHLLLRARTDSPLAERARRYRPAVLHHDMDRHGLRFVVPGDPEWPASLDHLAWSGAVGDVAGGVPLGLWLSGPRDLAVATAISCAIVGSRTATATGEVVASDLAAGVSEQGCSVISGGAYGIDAAAHRGALAAGGVTVAVMAGGLDEVYPAGNSAMLQRIRADGLLVSENPPGQRPSRLRFLARNRLIAALGVATVVVEAQVRSGARNTVAWAHGLQRPVLAVPGPVTSPQSETPNQLIRDGEAVLVAHAGHVMEAVAALAPEPRRSDSPALPLDGLTAMQKAVYEAFPARTAMSVDEVAYESRLRVHECLSALGELHLAGLAGPTEDGRWRLVR